MALTGKTAVVTGGASGIGRGICLHLARAGANIAIFDLDLPGAQKIADEVRALGRRALACQVDVANATNVQTAVEQVHQELGLVQILVNDAGIAEFLPFAHTTEEKWDRMIAVHMKGMFNCTKAVVQDMVNAGWGRIVNISSGAGVTGMENLVHYSSAKAGMLGFTKALAQELGPSGITVNAIAPGFIDTPIIAKSVPKDQMQQFAEIMIGRTPVRRIGKPDDIATACAYLASEEASFTTGQVLNVNGGVIT
ncbi:MAG: SDR family NAD(P)-dependent oxidoreductase [Candidatus Binatia bacterium]